MIIPYATSAVTQVRGQDVIDLFNQKVAEYSEDYPYNAFIVMENTMDISDLNLGGTSTLTEYSHIEIMSKWPIYPYHDENQYLGDANPFNGSRPVYGPVDSFNAWKSTPPSQRPSPYTDYYDETRIIISTIASQKTVNNRGVTTRLAKYTLFGDTNYFDGSETKMTVPVEKLDRPTRAAYYTYKDATPSGPKYWGSDLLWFGQIFKTDEGVTVNTGIGKFSTPHMTYRGATQFFTNKDYYISPAWAVTVHFKPRFTFLMSSNNPEFSSFDEWSEYLREHGADD